MMGLAFNILAQQMSHYGYSIHQIDADHYQLVALSDCESSSSELVSREQLLQRLEGLQRQIAED